MLHFEGRQCPFIDLLGGKGELFLVDPYTKDVALLGYQIYMYVYSGVVPARFSTLADLWLCIQLSDRSIREYTDCVFSSCDMNICDSTLSRLSW